MFDQRFDEDGLPYDKIAADMRLSVPSVVRLEESAIIKMRLGLRIFETLGRNRAERLLIELRGRPPADYHRALERARSASRRGGVL